MTWPDRKNINTLEKEKFVECPTGEVAVRVKQCQTFQVSNPDLISGTPTVANEAITNANTEYDYALPTGTKRVIMQNREDGLIKICFTINESGTNYWTIFPGQQKDIEFLNGSTGVHLYFQSPKATQTLEVESWV